MGGTAGNAVFDFPQGGDGGAGGDAGPITVTFNGNLTPDPAQGLADFGLVVGVEGGAGGEGGWTSVGGISQKNAGDGGQGGQGTRSRSSPAVRSAPRCKASR